MENLTKTKIIFIALCFAFLSCTTDNESNLLKNIEGTVLGTASCNTTSNGLAYRINIESLNSVNFIITASLTEEFKQDGIKIKFDMENSNEGITICTTNYSGDIFYKLSNIIRINNEN